MLWKNPNWCDWSNSRKKTLHSNMQAHIASWYVRSMPEIPFEGWIDSADNDSRTANVLTCAINIKIENIHRWKIFYTHTDFVRNLSTVGAWKDIWMFHSSLVVVQQASRVQCFVAKVKVSRDIFDIYAAIFGFSKLSINFLPRQLNISGFSDGYLFFVGHLSLLQVKYLHWIFRFVIHESHNTNCFVEFATNFARINNISDDFEPELCFLSHGRSLITQKMNRFTSPEQ